MKTVLLGVGQAGGKLATALARFDADAGYGAVLDALAVNTAAADLDPLPLDTVLVGQSRVSGHGVGGDNELGAEVMDEDATEVLDALSSKVTAEAEALFVVAGLGGGTGSGGAPVLVRDLSRVYDVPVYAIGILPGRDEGTMYQVNAGRSLKTLVREADATLLLDNDAWRSAGESVESGYAAVNESMARRVGLLLAAGESVEGVAESVVDTSEVINTLRAGGMAAVGFASAPAAEDAEENVTTVTSAVRSAVMTGMSLPNATDADAALVAVAGDPDRISRKGAEKARKWLQEETGSMQVRGGDFPLDSDRIAALVLLGGVERSRRVEAFLERARQAVRDEAEERVDPASAFDNDDLDDLL
ncbi:tubulin/FtsZ family protein [Halorubrum sp. SD626R]|jgi:cell division GTPase FtsZ|uniref:tubulin/FtsZ family protein n=1 Tax=Halorubrum sp. SD626R TaxID=1419722 RepID=UPI000A75D0E5|nr:tubulin/FtsZ family protein [Halorubrum sp. SD626R]TKX80864.1 cell division protein [Halorubrum sp. SD626R]